MVLFYEKNTHVLEHPEVNTTFEKLLLMSEEEFLQWVDKTREVILYSWDTYGCPLKSGLTEAEIIKQFQELRDQPCMNASRDTDANSGRTKNDPNRDKILKRMFETVDLQDKKTLVVQNIQRDGTAIDQFFPTMMKTRINYGNSDKGYSVYDLFADESKKKKLVTISRKCLKRDSFYYFSQTVPVVEGVTASDWIRGFVSSDGGFWIDAKKRTDAHKNTGYSQVDTSKQYFLSLGELEVLVKEGFIRAEHMTNLKQPLTDDKVYYIRTYKNGKKLFPHAFKAFRIGDIQIAVNFPPMTAKYLYQKYTAHITGQDKVIVYDPSSGWGGRILGAMSSDRKDGAIFHYVGNDPNTDNYIPELGKTRYEVVADFYNDNFHRGWEFGFTKPPNTYEVFRQGSETIHTNPDFQKYKGQLDFVFTSPPYFAKEAYSEDPTQSYKAYNTYDVWRDQFLFPTLKTAVEYLKEDRYLAWNIADVQFAGKWLPLEQDSIDILKSLGMTNIQRYKMALMNMPGQNRIGKDGKPTSGSFAYIETIRGTKEWIKTEPLIVAYKPKR